MPDVNFSLAPESNHADHSIATELSFDWPPDKALLLNNSVYAMLMAGKGKRHCRTLGP